MEPVLILALIVGFVLSYSFTSLWIDMAKKKGLVGKDMHKRMGLDVAEAGGIAFLTSFVLIVLFYILANVFLFKSNTNVIELFALLCSLLIAGFIGFSDDIIGWKIGLNKLSRVFLLVFASIPLVVINAGVSTVLGIEFGILFPLILVPVGIVGTTATFNFLAGFNGLEASQGILILGALSIVSYINGSAWLTFVLASMVVCLLGFYLLNKWPAKVFPGDVLTYSVGAMIAIAAVLGNMEKIAIFFFIPYIIEVGLKVRGKLKRESFAKLGEEGGLELPYKKLYSLTHVAIWVLKKFKKRVYEKEVVYFINAFQILVIVIGFLFILG